jgi:hypothetical protein
MAFQVIHPSGQQRIWVPVLAGQTVYTGSIVSVDVATPLEGVMPLQVAVGVLNTTNKDIPYGVVVGNNNTAGNSVFNSTYKTDYITAAAAGAAYGSTTQYQGVEGPWPKGDPIAMVMVDLIDPCTVLRGSIFNAVVGTAPTEATVTVGSGTDGIGCTSSAVEVASVANLATLYARSGKNRGTYRTLTSASTTTHVWLQAMYKDMEIGDKIVVVGLRPWGPCVGYIHVSGLFFDSSVTAATNTWGIDVIRLDLSEAGKEYVEFRFNTDHFCAIRA